MNSQNVVSGNRNILTSTAIGVKVVSYLPSSSIGSSDLQFLADGLGCQIETIKHRNAHVPKCYGGSGDRFKTTFLLSLLPPTGGGKTILRNIADAGNTVYGIGTYWVNKREV